MSFTTKGALSLLCGYGGDSSDDEVPGPRVSTKRVYRDDSDDDIAHKRLPLPIEFTKLPDNECHIDDPTSHDGRIRSFAHERGNWATFVYIPFEAQTGITELISYIKSIVPEHCGLRQSDDFHISLTKTVILKYHWINSCVESIKVNLKNFKKFLIIFDKLKVYTNEERTRTFIGIQTKSGHDTLLMIVANLDKCLEEFNLPPFYKDPSFHMSIAWAVGDHQDTFESFLPQMHSKFSELMQNYPEDNWYILVDFLVCKIGNKFFKFVLE